MRGDDRDRLRDTTLTFLTGAGASPALTFDEEDVVGRMKAGRFPPFLVDAGLPAGVPTGLRRLCVPSGFGGDDRKLAERSARGLELEAADERAVEREVPPTRLLPEFERERFSLELPESPRFTLTEDVGVEPGDLRREVLEPLMFRWRDSAEVSERTCAGASGRLTLALLLAEGAAALVTLAVPRRREPSLDCLLSDPVERVESARESERVGVAPPELCRDPEDRVRSSGKLGCAFSPFGLHGELCVPS